MGYAKNTLEFEIEHDEKSPFYHPKCWDEADAYEAELTCTEESMKSNWEKVWLFEILADQSKAHQNIILKFLEESCAQEFVEFQNYKEKEMAE